MRIETALILAAGLLILPALSYAKEPAPAEILPRGQISSAVQQAYAEAVNVCEGLGAFDSPEFTSCMQKAAATADAQVNEAYSQAMDMIVEPRKTEVAASQRAWLAFYRLNCDFEKPLAKTAYYDCIIKMAVERKIELRHRIGD